MAFTRLPNPVHVLMTRRDYRELRRRASACARLLLPCRRRYGQGTGRAPAAEMGRLIVVTNAPPRRRGTALP